MSLLRSYGHVLAVGAATTLLAACLASARLPRCIQGSAAPTSEQQTLWDGVAAAAELDMAIDGSGSMLGLTGSDKASTSWKALIKGVTLAASSNGLTVIPQRVGGGASQRLSSPLLAADPCFFKGCGTFRSVSSSLDSLWKAPGLSKTKIPLRLVISDLEVNDGDIAALVGAIRPHVKQGAVIGVLAVRLPFQGRVFNSQGAAIHDGAAKRPIYILATGPRSQLHSLLTEVRTKAALSGVPTDSMQLTFLDDQANAPTLTAKAVAGLTPASITTGLPIRLAGTTYSPSGDSSYQFAKLYANADGVTISSGANASLASQRPDFGLARLQTIPLAGDSPGLNGLSIQGFQMVGQELTVAIRIPKNLSGKAFRVVVPRGQLPESWWVDWSRQTPAAAVAHDQTDGLLLLLTSLSKLMVSPSTTPAASLCLAFSR